MLQPLTCAGIAWQRFLGVSICLFVDVPHLKEDLLPILIVAFLIQMEPVKAYRKWFDDRKAWKAYLHQPETMEILKKSHTVVLDPLEGEYCWRKRATLQARVERVFLLQMLEQGYQTELLKKIDESLLAKVERLEPPLLEYLDAHLNEERYYQDWQKIFFEVGHIYNKTDGHAEKSLPSYTFARQWLQHYGYDLQKRRVTNIEVE